MAMRGHSSIQGSTDIPTLYDLLPGYLPQPAADDGPRDARLATSSTRGCRPATGPTSASSSSACSRPGTATPPRRRTTSASTGCRASTATTRSCRTSTGWPKGEVNGYFLFGQNPGGGGPNAGLHRAGLRQPGLAGRRRLVRDRERRLLEERPERPAARGDQDRGLLHPRRRRAREGGHAHQHPAAAPVAQQGDRPARRLPVRRLVRLQPRQAAQGALRRLDRPEGPAAPEPDLGLRLRRAATPARRHRQPDRGRAGRREDPAGDQRLPRSTRSTRATGRPKLLSRLLRAEGRRHDRLRLLDLQRRLPRAGPQPGQRAEAHRQPGPARVGLRLAAQPPDPVQPRLGRPRGPAVVGAEEAHLVGRGEDAAGSATTSRTSSPTSRPTTARRRTRRAWTPSPATQPFIMKPDGVGWLYAPGGVKDGPLPTHYEPVESPVGNLLYPAAAEQPDRPDLRGAAQPPGARADGRVSRWSPARSG